MPTNAIQPMQRPRVKSGLIELNRRFGTRLTLRVSLDHHGRALHETERGSRTWPRTLAGLEWLARNGFRIAIAGRTCWGETEAEARAGYGRLIAEHAWPIDPARPAELMLLPEMDGTNRRVGSLLTLDVVPHGRYSTSAWRIVPFPKRHAQPVTNLESRPRLTMGQGKRNNVRKRKRAPNYISVNRSAYDNLVDQYAQRIESDTFGDTMLMAPFFLLLSQQYGGTKGLQLLDVGCGNGLNLRMMLEQGHLATGIDFSPKMAALAMQTARGARIIVGDYLTTHLPQDYFHGVFAKAILHLFPKRQAPEFFGRVRGGLRDRGVFYITTTAETAPSEGFSEKHDYTGAPVRFRARWTVSELRTALLENGFQIKSQRFDREESRGKLWINFWTTKA